MKIKKKTASRFKEDRIQQKLALSFISIVSLVLIIFGIHQCYEVKSIYVKEMNTFTKNTSAKLPKLLVYPLWNMDTEVIEKTVSSTMIDKQVYAVIVRENDGTMMTGKIRNDEWEVVSIGNQFKGKIEDKCILVREKILKDEDQIGTIEIYISKRFMIENLKCEIKKIVLNVFFMDLIAFILIWFITLNITRPILSIAENKNELNA